MDITIDDHDLAGDLAHALDDLDSAQPGYEKAEAYYTGEAEERFLSPTIRALLSGSDNDFRINLAGRVVDAVLDRLQIAALTAEKNTITVEGDSEVETSSPAGGVDDISEALDDPEDSQATHILNEVVWHGNDLDLEAPELHTKVESLGDAYLFVWPRTDEQGRTVGVDVHVNSPQSVRVFYDEENPRRKRFAVKKWRHGKQVRVNLYYPGTPGFLVKLVSRKDQAGSSAEQFEPYVDEHTDEHGVVEFPWDWEELPFFHFRIGGRPYGSPEHAQAYGPQDALTKLVNSMMSAADMSAFPQRYALLDPQATSDDDLDWDDDDDVAPEELESQLISGPGRVWMLRYVKQVGQFATTDLGQFLDPMNWFAEAMASVTGTPISYFRQVFGDRAMPASGASQRQGSAAFTSKVNARQAAIAASWREAMGFALKLLGVEATVTVRWKPPEVISTKEEWEAVKAKQEAGVPVRQTLLEVGYTEAEVTSWGYTEESPDGPGVDLGQFPVPPPTPGVPVPAGLQSAAEPPAPEGGE